MKLLFKQKMFSWFDSYNIYDENNDIVYKIKGKLAWGHKFEIYDQNEHYLGTVKEKILTFLPKFEIYDNDHLKGTISERFSLFKPKFDLDFNHWYIEGNFWQWDYNIYNSSGEIIAQIDKEIFHLVDTYVIDVSNEKDALDALIVTLTIDAIKCSRDRNSNN